MSKKPILSLDDFKKWIKEQAPYEEPVAINHLIGTMVESKVGLSKLLTKTEVEEGDEETICEDFLENGGTILDIDDKHVLIEVSAGQFTIHRAYIRKS